MNCLPERVVEHIIKYLNFKDTTNLGSTCSYLNKCIIKSEALWERRLKANYPKIYERIIDCWVNTGELYINWYTENKSLYVIRKRSRSLYMSILSQADVDQAMLKIKWEEDYLGSSSQFRYLYQTSFLKHISNKITKSSNLSQHEKTQAKYCIESLQNVANALQLYEDFTEYSKYPKYLQTHEYFYVILCYNLVEDYSHTETIKTLVERVKLIKEYVKTKYPNHPINLVPEDVQERWKDPNADEYEYTDEEKKQLMSAFNFIHQSNGGLGGFHSNAFFGKSKKDNLREITDCIIDLMITKRLGLKLRRDWFQPKIILNSKFFKIEYRFTSKPKLIVNKTR